MISENVLERLHILSTFTFVGVRFLTLSCNVVMFQV